MAEGWPNRPLSTDIVITAVMGFGCNEQRPLLVVLVERLFKKPVSGNAITPIAYTKPEIQLVAADGFTAVLAAGCPQCKKKATTPNHNTKK